MLVRSVTTEYKLFLGTTCKRIYSDLLFVDFELVNVCM
jgi:hypothetical protein